MLLTVFCPTPRKSLVSLFGLNDPLREGAPSCCGLLLLLLWWWSPSGLVVHGPPPAREFIRSWRLFWSFWSPNSTPPNPLAVVGGGGGLGEEEEVEEGGKFLRRAVALALLAEVVDPIWAAFWRRAVADMLGPLGPVV